MPLIAAQKRTLQTFRVGPLAAIGVAQGSWQSYPYTGFSPDRRRSLS